MVNVAGRSKGCSTCRKRRVKCDETRPICRRCQRGGFACDGPRGITIIIDRNSAQLPAANLRQSMCKASPNPMATLSTAGSELYICYTRAHLLRHGVVYSAIEGAKLDELIPSSHSAPKPRLSHQAILSLATILFGTEHRLDGIKTEGYALHGEALKQLNRALSDSSRWAEDEVIVAVAALAVSETLVPTAQDNNLKHMLGLERLLRLRDPFTFWAHNAPGFCEGVRFMVIFAGLQTQRPSVLARPDWQEAMRLHTAPGNLEGLELWIILAECTVLLAKVSEVKANWDIHDPKAVQLRSEVEDSAQVLLARLDVWRQFYDSVGALQAAAIPDQRNQRNSIDVFGTVDEQWTFAQLPIRDDSEAVALMLYNVARIHVLDVLAALPIAPTPDVAWHSDTAHSNQQFASDIYLTQGRMAALEACRLLHYYLGGNRHLTPSTSVTVHWATGTAWRRLRGDDSVEARWVRDVTGSKGRQVLSNGVYISYRVFSSIPT